MPCTAKVLDGKNAWEELLDVVEEYFKRGLERESDARVHQTKLPPVYLQRPNHSLTIVGLEMLKNGKRRLLVFDPGYLPPDAVKRDPRPRFSTASSWYVLWRYRRDEAYLKRFRGFEVLFLDCNRVETVKE